MRRLPLISLFVAHALFAATPDACEVKVPPPLRKILSLRFPGFRPTRIADQAEDATEYGKHAGGDGCITVALGDFDGDGQKDIALLLSHPQPDGVRLVVAGRILVHLPLADMVRERQCLLCANGEAWLVQAR